MGQDNPHGVIIKVENLELCRTFYRDVLNLGEPIMDSNFWVEFRVNDNFSLILEKIRPEEKLSVKKGRISWLYRVDDIERVVDRLSKQGYEPLADEKDRIGYKVIKFCDPEGNPFYLCN